VQADTAVFERRRDDATPRGPEVLHDAKVDPGARMQFDEVTELDGPTGTTGSRLSQ
jgi:hypothetical protein